MGTRVRFAPSPTGWLHIGGARTALYNYLYAKHNKGTFVLRIEDTDRTRSTEDAIQAIKSDLKWLGLEWDEGPGIEGKYGPYRQTERSLLYKKDIERLKQSGKVYECFCLPEELYKQREAAKKEKISFRYNRRCRNLNEGEKGRILSINPKPALRFKTPLSGTIRVRDIVRGEVKFDLSQLDDFIIARSDGTPTYNFAVVVDDANMKISHVIRGDDHLPNTPKQILIFEALGYEVPAYAHLSMILGSDKKPLSKRHGATAVFEFRKLGYLPEAMVNYLALLGWSLDDRTTFFTMEDLINNFKLEKVSTNPAVFDTEKLRWLNSYWIRLMPDNELAIRLKTFVEEKFGHIDEKNKEFHMLIQMTRKRIELLTDFNDWVSFYFISEEDFMIEKDDLQKLLEQLEQNTYKIKSILKAAKNKLALLKEWKVQYIEEALRSVAQESGIIAKNVFQSIRLAVTGRLISPPLFESIVVLGKTRTLNRLERLLDEIKSI